MDSHENVDEALGGRNPQPGVGTTGDGTAVGRAAGVGTRANPLLASDPRDLGGYRLLGRLGEGGMGTVYLGRDSGGRLVAVKVIRADIARIPEFRARFRREAQVARRVARFCTAEVLDVVDPPEGPPYLVTEFIDGPTLAQAVDANGPLPAADLERVAVSVAAALSAIHGAGLVHRDLKPANVLLSPFGPRVIDFGIAQAADSTTLTLARDTVVGTPAFMAPEQAEGEAVTSAADVFAWGSLVIFAGTGRRPFGDGPISTQLYRIVHVEPALDGLDSALAEVVRLAMRRDPADRPTAEALLRRLVLLGAVLDPALTATGTDIGASRLASSSVRSAEPASVGNTVGNTEEPTEARFAEQPSGRLIERSSEQLLERLTEETSDRDSDWPAPPERLPAGRDEPLNAAAAGDPRSPGWSVPPVPPVSHGSLVSSVSAVPSTPRPDASALATSSPARRRRGRVIRILAGIAVLGVLLVLAAVVAPTRWPDERPPPGESALSSDVVIPAALVGMSFNEAVASLRAAGLTSIERTAKPDARTPGTVIAVDPPSGARVDTTTPVTLTVSSGSGDVAIPDVVGEPEASARSRLEALGLTVLVRTNTGPATGAAGLVEQVEPSEGSHVPAGSRVTITVIRADSEPSVAMPDVVGRNVQQAETAVQEAGFTNVHLTYLPDASAADTVIATDPASGASVTRDTAVTLTVSIGPGHTTVDDVIGRTERDARSSLETAGLVVVVRQNTGPSSVGPGIVEKVEPPAGTQLPSRSTVTITVASVKVTVPNVVGRTQADAENTLLSYGFDVTSLGQASEVPAGTVLSQTPEAGIVTRGTIVTLVVARPATGGSGDPGTGPAR